MVYVVLSVYSFSSQYKVKNESSADLKIPRFSSSISTNKNTVQCHSETSLQPLEEFSITLSRQEEGVPKWHLTLAPYIKHKTNSELRTLEVYY